MWAKIQEKSKGIDYEIEIRTTNVHTHAMLSKDLELWTKIILLIKNELNQAIYQNENEK